MDEIRKEAMAMAREAGAIVKSLYGRRHDISFKGDIDLVTEADLQAERWITGKIQRLFPSHSIISEEGYPLRETSAAYWLVDPLDGTVNFAHNIPWFAVSLAFVAENRIRVGVVYQPLQDELFWAEEGKGAYLGETRLKVSGEATLVRSLIATGFPYDVHQRPQEALAPLASVLPRVQGIRRAGSAALDLAFVAAGRFEGFFEIKLKPWDTAAGVLLVREAGGRVTDFTGRPFDPFLQQVAATNGHIHQGLLDLLA